VEVDKSFATSIDDLVFSTPPSEIIDPDPKWAFEIEFTPGKEDQFRHDFGEIRVDRIGAAPTFDEAMKAANADAVLAGLSDCLYIEDTVDEETALVCLIQLAFEHPGHPLFEYGLEGMDLTSYMGATAWAAVKGDPSHCNALEYQDNQMCRSMFAHMGIASCKDLEPDPKAACLRTAWSAMLEPALRQVICQNVEDLALRAECLGEGDPDACAAYEASSHRFACYVNHAVTAGDASICDRMESVGNRTYCRQRVAAHTGNVEACLVIEHPSEKMACVRAIAVLGKDAAACDALDDREMRDRCRVRVGQETGDLDLCLSIGTLHDYDLREWDSDSDGYYPPESSYERDLCIVNAAGLKGVTDPSVCEQIRDLQGHGLRYPCLLNMALLTSKPDICLRAGTDNERVFCTFQVAFRAGNLEWCGLIDRTDLQEACRRAICDATSDPAIRGRCEQDVGPEGDPIVSTASTTSSPAGGFDPASIGCIDPPSGYAGSLEEWITFCVNSRCSSTVDRPPECDDR